MSAPALACRVRAVGAGDTDLQAVAALHGRAAVPPAEPGEHLLLAEQPGPEGALALATLRLRPAIGLVLPRVSYHVGCVVHAAPELGLFHRQRTLLLGNDHTGASELADIAWRRDEVSLPERAAALQALVGAALLLVARERARHADRLVAELPGPRDAAGCSPFWDGLGRHFYAGDPAAARAGHGADWRSHVATLLPRHPIYTSFLPPAAQAAIAQVDAGALLLREVLEAAGLRYGHHVNVEDGGPLLEVETDALAAVTTARRWLPAPEGSPAPAGRRVAATMVLAEHGAGWTALRTAAAPAGARLWLAHQPPGTTGVWAALPAADD